MNLKRSFSSVWALVLVLCLVLLSGCSSSTEPSATVAPTEAATEAPTEAPAETEAPVAEEATEEPAAEETPAEETVEETPVEETVEESPVEETVEETPAEETVEETPVEETVEETPAEETVEETPAEETVEETPTEETVEETPVEETVEETAAEATAEETPVEETVEATPVEETVEETAAEATAEETPAEETIEETPVEETAAEETVEEAAAEATVEETVTEETSEASAEATETDPVIAIVGSKEIRLSAAMPTYNSYVSMLTSYGYDASMYSDYIKAQVLSGLVQDAIESQKVAELGYDQFTAEELAAIETDATTTWNSMMEYYQTYFVSYYPNEDSEAMATEYLAQNGYTAETVLEMKKLTAATNAMATDLTKDVAVTDEAMQSYYETLVSNDETNYTGNYYSYEAARQNGTVITWNPEGYRRIHQLNVAFSEEDAAKYTELTAELETVTTAETAETAEARTEEEITADIEALAAPYYASAAELSEQIAAGTDVASLLTETDPADGWYIHSESTTYSDAVKQAAFALETPGTISDPFADASGVWLVYYIDEVPAGAVPLEDVRSLIEADCLSNLQTETYYSYLNTWSEELGVEYHLENFVTE